MITWTPEPGLFLIDTNESAVNVRAVIQAVQPASGGGGGDEGGGSTAVPIQEVRHTWTPEEPPKVRLTKQISSDRMSATIEVFFPDFIGVFPLQELKYIEGETRNTTDSWLSLPNSSRDIFSYKPHPVNHYIWELTLTLVPLGETVSYRIRVEANYNTGRDILIEEVNKRRRV